MTIILPRDLERGRGEGREREKCVWGGVENICGEERQIKGERNLKRWVERKRERNGEESDMEME